MLLKADDGFEAQVEIPGHPVHASAYDYLPDLMKLGEFSEPCLLHTVRSRFSDIGKIYTQIGSAILVSVNPYQDKGELFSARTAKLIQQESKMRKITNANAQNASEPHLFKMAEEALQSMKSNSMSQEIIISGISGAGKTEAAKLMLAYLANACNNFKYIDPGE